MRIAAHRQGVAQEPQDESRHEDRPLAANEGDEGRAPAIGPSEREMPMPTAQGRAQRSQRRSRIAPEPGRPESQDGRIPLDDQVGDLRHQIVGIRRHAHQDAYENRLNGRVSKRHPHRRAEMKSKQRAERRGGSNKAHRTLVYAAPAPRFQTAAGFRRHLPLSEPKSAVKDALRSEP